MARERQDGHYKRLVQDLVNGREGQFSLLVQSRFIRDSPHVFVRDTQSKDRCPVSLEDLSVRAVEWMSTWGLEIHRSPDSNAAICEVLAGICRTSHTRGRRCRSRGTRTHRIRVIRVTISRSIDTFQLKRRLWITHKRRRTSTRPQPRGRQPASLLRSIRMCRVRSG
ncbi:hypothetical protein D1006_26650 [Burkholderia stabilis]|uniref:Uncharacterized protein n=1 Tax=Burkholderia stabilis TaxID=95485 RepID=A0A4Q2AH06_9BURK|nr:hypothetical protein D1006_26650 [Burkholderia stabilis]